MEAVLKVEDVAGLMNVSMMTVYRLIEKEELPAIRFGRSFRVDPDDLMVYLRGRESGRPGLKSVIAKLNKLMGYQHHNLLTIQEVAHKLRVSDQTIYRPMNKGELVYIKVGTHRRIEFADLADFLTKCRTGESRLEREGWGESFDALEFMNSAEMAEILRVVPQTVLGYIREGVIPGVQYQYRGFCVVERAEFEAYVQSSRSDSPGFRDEAWE